MTDIGKTGDVVHSPYIPATEAPAELTPSAPVLVGAFLAVAMQLIGVPPLPVAVGVRFPIST